MTKQKLNIAVLMGGQSAEHEVSLQSAKNVLTGLATAANAARYQVLPIGIHKDGAWFLQDLSNCFLNADNPKTIALKPSDKKILILPGGGAKSLVCGSETLTVDAVFPMLHGSYGEDGTLQGLLRLIDRPFVGADVLGTAVGMDKDVMKRLFRDAGLPTARFLVFDSAAAARDAYGSVVKTLGDIVFVKPANTGSSVGVHKVKTASDWQNAVADAFQYDGKIIVEEFIAGREIECAVLGNDAPQASLPGEIICHHEFYSYDAKYIDPNGASVEIPARLPEATVAQIQTLAQKTMRVLCCEGLARVDFFVTAKNEIYINEINTLPGFTNISMYPKMWEKSGLPQPELLHRLIELALQRHQKQKAHKTDFF